MSLRSGAGSAAGLMQFYRHAWPHLRRERAGIALGIGTLVCGTLLRLLEPWPLKFVFDRVFKPDATGNVLPGWSDEWLLLAAAGAVLVFSGGRALADYVRTVSLSIVGNRVLARIREEVFGQLQCLSLQFHNSARGGDLLVRVISDVNMLKDVATSALMPLMANALILVGMVALMVWLQWQLALVAFATLPLFWLVTIRLGKRIQEVAKKQRRWEGAMAATASEAITSIKAVQAMALEESFNEAFRSRSSASIKGDAKGSRLSAGLERGVEALIAVATALVLYLGGKMALAGQMTPGDLLVFLTYLRRVFNPLQDFAKYAGRLAKASAAAERVLDLLHRHAGVVDLPDARPIDIVHGAVRFEHVDFGYDDALVLRDFEFAIEPGECVAIMGESGRGKSTLVHLLLRLYDPTKGAVRIDGHDLKEFTLASLRTQIATVMQDTILFSGTIRENIALGRPDAEFEEIEAAARLANAHEFVMGMPLGYDSVVGERGVTLSSGQRQRLSIARAALREAPILVLDEPLTGLDEENQREVGAALRRLARGRTTLLVTHDPHHAAQCDRTVVLGGLQGSEGALHAGTG